MVNVLADHHHGELFYSLQLLFEKRLNWSLYTPIGLEWYHEGYWNVYPHIDTARQFLGTNQAVNPAKQADGKPFPESAQLNKYYTYEDGIYYVKDVTKDKVRRGITFDKFKEMEFDIIISSMPQHAGPFDKLIKLYQPKAKHIFQIGNAWSPPAMVNNVMASIKPFPIKDKNVCFYHQEFDLDVFTCQKPPAGPKRNVYSFIHYMQKKEIMNKFSAAFPDWQWKSFGAGMEDSLCKSVDIADAYHNASWFWYYKPGGDGYGHGLYNAAATGTPMLVWGEHLRHKLAEELLTDKKTCIDISTRSVAESVELIKHFSQPEELNAMSQRMAKRFKQCVDFEEEGEKIRRFLESLR